MSIIDKCVLIANDIYNVLGHEQMEETYQNAFEVAFILDKIKHDREKDLPIYYRGMIVGRGRADFIVYDKPCTLILETKAESSWGETVAPDNIAQVSNYMKSFGICEGLLVNFAQSPTTSKKSAPIKPEIFIIKDNNAIPVK